MIRIIEIVLVEIIKRSSEDFALDMLYRAAISIRFDKLMAAIEAYWQTEANALTEEEYNAAQEQSIKEQFSND